MIRKELGYGPAEWGALPWHWQRAFLEELTVDGKIDGGADDGEVELDELAANGITVRR